MKTVNIVIFLIIGAILAIGLYLFQQNKQSNALIAHNIQKYQQITKTAKKSSPAGLLAMASAINTFHKKKGHYPDSLLKLYPDIIPEESFITELNWKYYPEKGGYLIQKSIEGGKIIASMGPDFKLKTEMYVSATGTKMLASVTKPKAKKKILKNPILKIPKTESDTKKNKADNKLAKIALQDQIKTSSNMKPKKEEKTSQPNQSINIKKKELSNNEKYLLSLDGAGFYIWKTKEGIIGFSDTQYPDEKKLTMFRDQSWIEYDYSPTSAK